MNARVIARIKFFSVQHVLTSLMYLLCQHQILNSFHDHDACIVRHQLQENDLSYLACEELGSIVQSILKIVQIDLSSFITNWESDALIGSSDHYSVFDDCHSCYHFNTSISNGICFTSFNFHLSTSRYSYFCRVVEALQSPLMVMSGPHCLDMSTGYDQICFPS